MAKGRNRRLTAVLMADIAGYTKLVEQDTDGTVAAWTTARDAVIDPKIAAKPASDLFTSQAAPRPNCGL